MRLNKSTSHAVRILIDCAKAEGRLIKVAEIAERLDITPQNAFKIVHLLSKAGFLGSVRGRHGGVRLARPAAKIRIGDVVRASETDFRLVECFDPRTNVCTLTPSCRLKHLFDAALQAYFRELDGATLADMVASGPPRAAARRVGAAGHRPAFAIAVAAPPSRPRSAKAAVPRG